MPLRDGVEELPREGAEPSTRDGVGVPEAPIDEPPQDAAERFPRVGSGVTRAPIAEFPHDGADVVEAAVFNEPGVAVPALPKAGGLTDYPARPDPWFQAGLFERGVAGVAGREPEAWVGLSEVSFLVPLLLSAAD